MTTPAEENQNASQKPKVFYARHMEPGVCYYDGKGKDGKDNGDMVLIEAEDMKKFMPSMAGCPVYVLHQKVDFGKIEKADGLISECFYNELDGWLWCKFIVSSDAGMRAIANGWKVSNAYLPLEWTGKGVYHNLDYSRKIVNAEFTHMAIVPNPRYEKAEIFTPEQFKDYQEKLKAKLAELHNSKTKGIITMKIFRTKKEEVKTEGVDKKEISFELENGEEMTLEQAEQFYLENAKAKKNAEDEDKKKDKDEGEEKINMDSEIQCGDEKMTVKELMNRVNAMKKNADDDKAKEKEAEEKANAEKEEKDKADKEKQNALDAKAAADKKAAGLKNFKELQNAGAKATRIVDTKMDKVARGKVKYGSGE